jgi:Heparinase II/III-like protein/Heparinase II/III N-terminus
MRDEVKTSFFSFIPDPSALILKFGARALALEAARRSRARLRRRRERAMLDDLNERRARLSAEYARMPVSELLKHFRSRTDPKFLPGFAAPASSLASWQRDLFPVETTRLLETATRMTDEHAWALLGYEERSFNEEIDWRRDPVSGAEWPLDYHGDIQLTGRGDGSDVRVLWELNRLAHLVTLARAFTITDDERFATAVFEQVESWSDQNPVGRGANWACAMEAALRAINLLAAFELLRRSRELNEERLLALLTVFDQHGAHIERNLEFSYISTSNHYLSDVAGLLWLGVMLPELQAASRWRELGRRELLREMDKQVLTDGADCEASTGYHRFVLELFLYSFILARANHLEVEEKRWYRLRGMFDYMRAYLRPDGCAPLVGDTDGGQFLPINKRAGDDHAYLLAVGAALFDEPRFRLPAHEMPEELLWVTGIEGVLSYEKLRPADDGRIESQAFADAGTYIMREGDLYLLFNASGNGLYGRGSHGHNDALSVEVSACGSSFLVDPGTYVYSHDLKERHLFRSTAYHSTVEVDTAEQNTTAERLPFVLGDEAHPRVLLWETTDERDLVVAEHDGYRRLPAPITHRRAVEFDKRERYWIIEDTLEGSGEHLFRFRFHMAPGLETSIYADNSVRACDKIKNARLFIVPLNLEERPELEPRFASRDYGAKKPSVSACWTLRRSGAPALIVRWALVPVCAGEDEDARLKALIDQRSAFSFSSLLKAEC